MFRIKIMMEMIRITIKIMITIMINKRNRDQKYD